MTEKQTWIQIDMNTYRHTDTQGMLTGNLEARTCDPCSTLKHVLWPANTQVSLGLNNNIYTGQNT